MDIANRVGRWSRAAMLLAAVFLDACGGGGTSPAVPGVDSQVAKQASDCTLGMIVVAVEAIRIKGEGPWIDLPLATPRRIDLLHSYGVLSSEGAPPLPPGDWHEVRLVLADTGNEVRSSGIPPAVLQVPGGMLRLGGDLEVADNALADVVPVYESTCAAVRMVGGRFVLGGNVAAQLKPLPFATDRESPAPGPLRPLADGGFLSALTNFAGHYTLQRFDSFGKPTTIPIDTDVSNSGLFTAIAPLVNGYLAVWLGPPFDPSQRFIPSFPLMAQARGLDGAPTAPPVQVAVTQPFTARIVQPSLPRVAPLSDGGAALVWVQFDVGSLNVYVQRFASDGSLRGAPSLAGSGGLPNVAGLTGARVLPAWGTGSLFARVFQADGSAGPEQSIAPSAASLSGPPVPAALANGGAVVAWAAQVFSDTLVEFVRLAPDGAPLGPPVIADGSTGPNPVPAPQFQFSVGGLADGSFVVAWSARGTIYARRFGADGAALGPVTTINVTTTSAGGASVVPLGWGGFLIGWVGTADGTVQAVARLFGTGGLVAAPSGRD